MMTKRLTAEEETVILIKRAIAALPPASEEQCNEMIVHIQRMVAAAGEPVGSLVVALVGAEMQLAVSRLDAREGNDGA
jgi:hypothetical protein